MPQTTTRIVVPTMAIGLLALGALGYAGISTLRVSSEPRQAGSSLSTGTTTSPGPLGELNLLAKAAYVLDLQSGQILYAKNEGIQLPLASLTKLMSSLVVAASLPKNSTATLSHRDVSVEGGYGLKEGESYRVNDLLSYALTASSNSAMQALASAALSENPGTQKFTDLMNERAKRMGLSQTYFVNETGLDPSSSLSGGYGSARDVATLLSDIVARHGELLEPTTKESVTIAGIALGTPVTHTATNTDEALGAIPGLIGGKTGFTDLAGGNLAVAFDLGLHHPLVAVVLGSTPEGRFTDMITIAQSAQVYITKH